MRRKHSRSYAIAVLLTAVTSLGGAISDDQRVRIDKVTDA